MKHDVYEYNKSKNKYEFLDCMASKRMKEKGIDEKQRISVGFVGIGLKNIQKYIIK